LVHTGEAMAEKERELGFKFYGWLALLTILGGVALLVVLLIFSRAIYAWGILGAFLVISAILLLVGWWFDRREVQRYGAETD
jgi:hypothetical protein